MENQKSIQHNDLPKETAQPADKKSSARSKHYELILALRRGTRLLAIVSAGLGFYIMSSLVFPSVPTTQPLPDDLNTVVENVQEQPPMEGAAKDFEAYAETFGKKGLFETPFERNAAAVPDVPLGNEPIAPNVDWVNDYKVVGIVLDGQPRAVIEDVKNQTTLFLSPGDSIGEAVVESVQAGKVILRYQEQPVELIP